MTYGIWRSIIRSRFRVYNDVIGLQLVGTTAAGSLCIGHTPQSFLLVPSLLGNILALVASAHVPGLFCGELVHRGADLETRVVLVAQIINCSSLLVVRHELSQLGWRTRVVHVRQLIPSIISFWGSLKHILDAWLQKSTGSTFHDLAVMVHNRAGFRKFSVRIELICNCLLGQLAVGACRLLPRFCSGPLSSQALHILVYAPQIHP
mmetsp:Transcript_36397/g.69824  ORF Transcript_36397/g.69824 Transcript_36397/m.69824 type:complete len:206 (+) Transcript_36397:3187-3804(+)